MCSMVLKPETVGFGAVPPQKWAFFAQKWPKNANIGPKTLFFGLGRSIQGPPTLFRTCLARKNISCMVWKPANKFFRYAPPKKWPFSGQKWPKIANFGQKSSIFGPGCSGQGPPTLFFRCLTRENMCCMVLKQKNGCCRAAPTQKWAFLGQKWPKIANFGQKSSVFGLGCSVFDPPTLFFWFLTQKNMCCMVLKPENGCFRAAPPKKWPFSGQKWPKIANFGQKSSVFVLGCSDQGPPTLFFRSLARGNM